MEQVVLPMAWARAMTTSWQEVASVTPQTTLCTPSTQTFSSMSPVHDGAHGRMAPLMAA